MTHEFGRGENGKALIRYGGDRRYGIAIFIDHWMVIERGWRWAGGYC